MGNWLKKPPTEKIDIVHVSDWDAIYVDGKLVHWHDALPSSELLSRLGLKVETHHPESESIGFADEDEFPEKDMPETFGELVELAKALKRKRLNAEIAVKKAELKALEDQTTVS